MHTKFDIYVFISTNIIVNKNRVGHGSGWVGKTFINNYNFFILALFI
jgi:hypothetical protein